MTETTAADIQETEATTEYVAQDLNGEPIRIKLVTKWRPSYVRALNSGDVDTWAAGVVHPDDLDAWDEADPTFEEIGEFASRAMQASGEAPGKSNGRAKSSRATRRK